jgi:hypothetical protein
MADEDRVGAGEMTDGGTGELRAHLTFFGKPRYAPEVGERVEVRVQDGSWRGGFRAITGVTADGEYPGEEVVWISAEDEWRAARAECREPGGAPWPLEQMRPAGER